MDTMTLCTCAHVEMGTYAATVSMRTPAEKWVGIDVCIATEIGRLWMHGVVTLGSCCGHGKLAPSVVVSDESIPRMRELGYQNYGAPYGSRADIFILEGKPLPVAQDNPYYQAWQKRLRSDPSDGSQ